MKQGWVRREGGSELILKMLVWGVLTVLVTRAYLNFMDWPAVSFGEWHIAHVLWGGLLMIMAMIIVLAFEGQKIRRNMAILFGVGFGLFIDETGKYLTKDNNYWFQPAFIFIYMSFVLMFLFYKYLDRQNKKTDKEKFYSILRNLEEVGENDLEVSEKREMLIKLTELKLTGSKNERTSAMAMEKMVKKIRAKSDRKNNNSWQIIKNWLQPLVGTVVSKNLVQLSLWLYAIYYSLTRIVDLYLWLMTENKNFDMMALKIIFETVVAILFLLGARWWWSQKRTRALRLFRYGLYVNILLVSMFKFYFEQFGAIYDVVLAMVLMELLSEYKIKSKTLNSKL